MAQRATANSVQLTMRTTALTIRREPARAQRRDRARREPPPPAARRRPVVCRDDGSHTPPHGDALMPRRR